MLKYLNIFLCIQLGNKDNKGAFMMTELNIGVLDKVENLGEDKKLFIGIDIGKENNYSSFVLRGRKREIKKRLKTKNNVYGFYKLLEELEKLLIEQSIDLDEVIIGIESTGHYWQNLYDFFDKRNYDVVMVKNRLVKLKREAKYSQKGKNDSIDCHCIALVLLDDDYFIIRKNDRNYDSLRRLSRTKEDYVKLSTQNKNRLRAWIDVNNPVYLMCFVDPFCKTGRAILRDFPSSRDIVNKDIDDIIEILKNDERNKGILYRMVTEYIQLCQELYKDTIKISEGDREEVAIYLSAYESIEDMLDKLKIRINKLAKETIVQLDNFTSIKGLGENEIIDLIAEIGKIENFDCARRLQSYFGLGIKSEQSGNGVMKKPSINKAGNRRGRRGVYHMSMNLVDKNSDWRKLYCYYKAYNRKNSSSNKKMLVAVSCKLLRTIYGILKYNQSFDSEMIFKNLDFSKCNKEKFIEEYNDKKGKWRIGEEELEELFEKPNLNENF